MSGSSRGAAARTAQAALVAVFAAGMLLAPPPKGTLGQDQQLVTLPANPIMYATPFCFTSGGSQTVMISGRNFEPNANVQVSKSDDLGVSTGATISAYGAFTATLTLNVDPQYPGVRLDARIVSGGDVPPPIAVVYINSCGSDAQVTATPNCGDPDNPSIHVTGARFPFSTNIHVELTNGTTAIGKGIDAPAGSTFDVTFQPGVKLDPGTYTIQATQTDGEFNAFGYDTFVVPCPQVTITPVCAPAGGPPDTMAISISGSGWLSGTADGEDELQIVFDPAGEAQEFSWSGDPYSGTGLGAGGTFGPFLFAPFARPAKQYTIEVRQQGYGPDPVLDISLTFNVPCEQPSIAADPTCGPPELVGDVKKRYAATITGRAFIPNQGITVTFDADSSAGPNYPPESFSSVVNTDGTFKLSVDSAYRPPGSYRVVANQDLSAGRVQASTIFTVPCAPPAPALTLEPTCGSEAAGQPGAYSIAASGIGFVPGPVEFVFDPTGVPESPPQPTIAGDKGNVSAELVVNGRPPGTYQVLARQTTVLGVFTEASATFVVSCEGTLLKITPTTGPRGFVPLVEGFGFPANTTVILRWDFGIGSSTPMTAQTDANGQFIKQVLIFDHDFLGLRHLTVELPKNPAAFPGLAATYLVAAGTIAPPFVIDNPFGPPDPIVLRR